MQIQYNLNKNSIKDLEKKKTNSGGGDKKLILEFT